MTFTSRDRSSRSETDLGISTVKLATEATVACADVDSFGHILSRRVDPDVSRPNDEYLERTTYVVAATPSSPCSDCLNTVTQTDLAGNLLTSARYTYDGAWHANALFVMTDAGKPESLASSWVYNGNGTLASKSEGSVTSSYQYDRYQLRLARTQVSEGPKALATDYSYDDFGYQNLASCPYVVGAGVAVAQRVTAYDDLGRVRVVARNPAVGNQITGALKAMTYQDHVYGSAVPASVTAYDFAVPLNYLDGAVPQSSDVRQTTTYLDGLGRAVQRRERLGGAGAGDPSASILQTQNLTGYRVSGAVYDGAGRIRAELEPFYTTNASYVEYRSSPVDSLSAVLHVTLHSYDSMGREICAAYQAMAQNSIVPPASSTCRSSFGENSGYTRAVAIVYRVFSDGTGTHLGVKTIPAENNLAMTPEGRAPNGPESVYDAAGRVCWTTDVDGNKTTPSYDLLGRVTGVTRDAVGRPSITTTSVYDMLGRVVRHRDPNTGTRDFTYDAQGKLLVLQLPAHEVGNGLSGRDEIRLGYDMGRMSTGDICTASSVGAPGGTWAVQVNCSRESTLAYDIPYGSNYQHVAGRLSYASSYAPSSSTPLTTIEFGYSPEGVVTQRDQQISGFPANVTFSASRSTLLDGQTVQNSFSSPYGSLAYQVSYDSFRRPAQVGPPGSTATYWSVPGGSTTGAYDPLGRLNVFGADSGLVQGSWQYGTYSGLESSARISLGASDLYSLSSEVYSGSKLTSCTDDVGKTNYRYWYSDAGRLRAASATPFAASSLSQNARLCMSYNVSKSYSSGASFGNLERVRNQAMSPANVETYGYTGTDVTGAAPGTAPPVVTAPGPDAPASISTPTVNTISHDRSGRISGKSATSETFQYDPLDRLTQITRAGAQAEVLAYDPMGNLLGRLVGNTLTYYIAGQATAITTAPAGCTAPGCNFGASAALTIDVHVTVGSRRVASIRANSPSARVLYYHRDRLGSVMATSMGGGMTGASYRWGLHGDLAVALMETGDSASEMGFTGSLRLSGGLLVMGLRIYDPKLKQFLQPDVIDPMTYTYAGGDPVNAFDPSGMAALSIEQHDRDSVALIGHVMGVARLSPMDCKGSGCYRGSPLWLALNSGASTRFLGANRQRSASGHPSFRGDVSPAVEQALNVIMSNPVIGLSAMANDPGFTVRFVQTQGLFDFTTYTPLLGETFPLTHTTSSGMKIIGAQIYYDTGLIAESGESLQVVIVHELGHAYAIYIGDSNYASEYIPMFFENTLEGAYGFTTGLCSETCLGQSLR